MIPGKEVMEYEMANGDEIQSFDEIGFFGDDKISPVYVLIPSAYGSLSFQL